MRTVEYYDYETNTWSGTEWSTLVSGSEPNAVTKSSKRFLWKLIHEPTVLASGRMMYSSKPFPVGTAL